MTSEMLLQEAAELRDCISRERRVLHQNPETSMPAKRNRIPANKIFPPGSPEVI